MARKPTTKRAPTKSSAAARIIVAVGELRGGDVVLGDGQELTADLAKGIGLDDETIRDLLDRGKLAEVKVRKAEGGDDGALAAAIARADAAEEKVAELEQQLAAATKPAG